MRKIYEGGDPLDPMEGHECTCLFHWSTSLDKITQKRIKPSLQQQYKQFYKEYKDAKSMEDVEVKYHVMRAWWLSIGATIEEGMYILFEWLGLWHYHRQWGGHMLIVSFQFSNYFFLCRYLYNNLVLLDSYIFSF